MNSNKSKKVKNSEPESIIEPEPEHESKVEIKKKIKNQELEPEPEPEAELESKIEIKKKISKKKVQENYLYKIAELDDEYDLLTRLDNDGNFKMQKKINRNKYEELFNDKKLIISKPVARGGNKINIIVKDKEFKINYTNIP